VILTFRDENLDSKLGEFFVGFSMDMDMQHGMDMQQGH
jgi:hypothetical protein